MSRLFNIEEISTDEGNGALYRAHFPLVSCGELLDLSDDLNREFHLPTEDGAPGVLQGIAVWLALGAIISRWRPGMGPDRGAFQFSCPIRVGDSALYTLRQVGKRSARCIISAEDGSQLFAAKMRLMPLKALRRVLQSRLAA